MHRKPLLRLTASIAVCLPLATTFVIPTSVDDQTLFSISPNVPLEDTGSLDQAFRKPTRYESTVLARRLLALSPTGVLSTIFPTTNSSSSSFSPLYSSSEGETEETEEHDSDDIHDTENRPYTLRGSPFGMIEYIADCEGTGNPTVIGIDIATTFKNAGPPRDGGHSGDGDDSDGRIRNISLSIDWWTQYRDLRREQGKSGSEGEEKASDYDYDLGLYSPASLPRVTLIGHLETIPHHTLVHSQIPACFLSLHPDAHWWAPENPDGAHAGRWLRLVVEEVYWFGGFGDRAYIGWLDGMEYKKVTDRQWRQSRLPGEE